MARKSIKAEYETEVLLRSRRRCSLCFGLDNDFKIKRGQIAHIDQNNVNSDFDNLVFLCFEHHDEYDSRTSQSKGLKPAELKLHRSNLYNFVAKWEANSQRVEQNSSQQQNKINNKFAVYQLANSDSVCGYNFLALNESRQVYISISDDHFSIDSFYWEVSRWLNCDYKKIHTSFDFDFIKLTEFINQNLFEKNFSITAYTKEMNNISSIVLTFNETHKYYELEYSLSQNCLQKVADGFTTEIDFNDTEDNDVLTYKGILDRLAVLNDIRMNILMDRK